MGVAEHPQPRPEPSDLTSKERGREVQQKRDTREGASGRGLWWHLAGDGGAEEQVGRWRRAAFPTRPPLCTPPPTFSRGPSSPTTGKATGPNRPPRARHLPNVFPSLPSYPALHGWRRGSQAGLGEARPLHCSWNRPG